MEKLYCPIPLKFLSRPSLPCTVCWRMSTWPRWRWQWWWWWLWCLQWQWWWWWLWWKMRRISRHIYRRSLLAVETAESSAASVPLVSIYKDLIILIIIRIMIMMILMMIRSLVSIRIVLIMIYLATTIAIRMMMMMHDLKGHDCNCWKQKAVLLQSRSNPGWIKSQLLCARQFLETGR